MGSILNRQRFRFAARGYNVSIFAVIREMSAASCFAVIISPMASSELPFGIDRTRLRLDGKDPYLCLHFVIIFVRDQERSLRFFADKLGFRVVVDHTFEDGNRWIEVGPPDGTAQLGIALAPPGSESEKLIGGPTDIYFITEDLPGKYKEWSERGVHFQFPPQVPAWGGIHTRFEDPDGNSFGLVGFDELTRGVETHRRALAQKLESERRAAQELEIAKQFQARLFPQIHPEAKTLEYAGRASQPARSAATTTTSSISASTSSASSSATFPAKASPPLFSWPTCRQTSAARVPSPWIIRNACSNP